MVWLGVVEGGFWLGWGGGVGLWIVVVWLLGGFVLLVCIGIALLGFRWRGVFGCLLVLIVGRF